ncbi:MAG: hypothetical protein QN183_11605 [Armatimonadota bacterium]|nr:hypothetical protein [Armatimonadota bacterium]MDR7485117.1 hypothetical protein [Armatimonadota bacterium]MDR7533505.1 hypothetical protein [Armatimonadota bacterium]MDR7536994.1 hypothetical protein [Armatimonadota bacterium]
MKRILLALVPVAILATASLAFTQIYKNPLEEIAPPAEDAAAVKPAEEDVATTAAPAPEVRKTVVAQSEPQKPRQQQEESTVQVATEEKEEPLPELVVDKTPLMQAMAELDRALDEAKLAVVAVDASAQRRHIQESVNLLAGAGEPNFRLIAGSPDSYKGVRPLLIQARVVREAAEVQWIAAVQRRSEEAAKRLAELAQAGNGTDTPTPQPAQPALDLSATVGPSGVLGTRGVRPEEQAQQLIDRAIRQAAEALALAARTQPTGGGAGLEGDAQTPRVSDEAAQIMQSVVRTLETAKKIVQIAIDR